MKIDFNNVRRQACYSFDRLVKTLNQNLEKAANGHQVVRVYTDEIENELCDLGQLIGIIAATFDEGNPDMVDLYDEVGVRETFNPNPEDDENEE